jgi:uroporphyrinogen decarboxylase
MAAGARHVLDACPFSPHIFNVGHGVTPQSPPEHVKRRLDVIRRT